MILEKSNKWKNGRWKGDKAGYSAKHLWIRRNYGNAKYCCKCHSTTAKRFEWANISGTHLRDISDYMPLCPSCHRKMDYGNFCKRGHEFTEENTRLNIMNRMICKECIRIKRGNKKRNIKKH